jgi:hypothetical protein
MWKNPATYGVAAAAVFYLYRIYRRSQEPEETRQEVSFVMPALIGCAVAGMAYMYMNEGMGINDVDSDFESGLVDMVEIDRVAPRPTVPNLDVYTAVWE